ncbi:MAG TPA: hypothetical protein VNX29_02560 [Kaistia sp.]|nr:hypothetical protein [Kaistia sp.]
MIVDHRVVDGRKYHQPIHFPAGGASKKCRTFGYAAILRHGAFPGREQVANVTKMRRFFDPPFDIVDSSGHITLMRWPLPNLRHDNPNWLKSSFQASRK